MRKDFTLTYGLSYTIEMPPYEVNGKQVQVVDTSGNLVGVENYLAQDQAANSTVNPTIQASGLKLSETLTRTANIRTIRFTAASARAYRQLGIRASRAAFWALFWATARR